MPTEKEIKDWYNKRHLAGGEKAWRPFEAYPVFLDYLDVQPGKRLLDVACGTGHLLKAAALRGLETYGVDISEEAVKISAQNSPDSKVSVSRGEELNFPDAHFDYVTCLGALEHFLNMEKGLGEMVRVAKPQASLLILVPNVNYLPWKFKGKPGTEQQDINEQLFSLKEWKDFFSRQNLDIVSVKQDKWFMRATRLFASKNPLGIARRLLQKAGWALLPLNYTYQFIFVMKKKHNHKDTKTQRILDI